MKLTLYGIMFFLVACTPSTIKKDIPLPRITTPTEMYPTQTRTYSILSISATETKSSIETQTGPYVDSEPIIWLPMELRSSSFINGIPVINNGFLKINKPPEKFKIFWDYDWRTDSLAYGDIPPYPDPDCGNSGASTLRIHNYQENVDYFVMDNITNVKWAPEINSETGEHMIAVIKCNKQLEIFSLNQIENKKLLSTDAHSKIYWSPDGSQIAYSKNNSIHVISINEGEDRIIFTNTTNVNNWSFSMAWVKGHKSIIYSASPFVIINVDGTEVFTPVLENGHLPDGKHAYDILWDDESHMLITEESGLWGLPTIHMYRLSEDLHTIVESRIIETNYLLRYPLYSWWVPGESILTNGWIVWSVHENNKLLFTLPISN
jgi:hypothetical protein